MKKAIPTLFVLATSAFAQPVLTPPVFVPTGAGPTVTSVTTNQAGLSPSVNQGTTAGGTPVVITGTGFSNATAVNFGSTSAGTKWWISSPTSITVASPAASAGTVDIRVTNPSGQSATSAADQFTYVAPSGLPTVTSVTPTTDAATGGDTISIVGTNINNTGSGISQACFGTTCVNIFPAVTNNITLATPAHAAGTVHVTIVNPTGTSATTNADLFTYGPLPSIPPIPATATRPSYNTGNGFFVVGRGIYDANGNLFTPVGANRTHFDWSEEERFAIGFNTERTVPFFRPSDTFNSSAQEGLQTDDINNFVVPIPTILYTDYTTGAQINQQPTIAALQTAYSFFTNNVTNWALTPYAGTSFTGNQISWFDPANEWGPCQNDTTASVYRQGWLQAVPAMRTAGYTAPIVVDSGCLAEGPDTLMADAAVIEANDPLHNVIFAIHAYGSFYNNSGSPPCGGCGFHFVPSMVSLAQLTVPVIIGEFGCANCQDNGSVNNPVSSDIIMQTAINNQFGYLAWAWDDSSGSYYCNNGAIPNCEALLLLGTNSLASPFQACYKNAAGTEVTGTAGGTNVGGTYGHDVITSTPNGILAVAPKVATVFTGTRPPPGTCPF